MPWLYRAKGGLIDAGESAREMIVLHGEGQKSLDASRFCRPRHLQFEYAGCSRNAAPFFLCESGDRQRRPVLPIKQQIARIKMLSGNSLAVHPAGWRGCWDIRGPRWQ
jgi:hypothetical protein